MSVASITLRLAHLVEEGDTIDISDDDYETSPGTDTDLPFSIEDIDSDEEDFIYINALGQELKVPYGNKVKVVIDW